MKLSFVITAFFAAFVVAQNSAGNNNFLGTNPQQRYVIDQTRAWRIVNAAASKAANISVPVNIAVTDPAGLLVAFLRMDNAYPGSIDIAIKKAKTVSLFNGAYTTAGLYPLVQPGAALYGIEETNGGLVAFGGGIPITFMGILFGAIGVSGGTTDQDTMIASAGVSAVGGYVTMKR